MGFPRLQSELQAQRGRVIGMSHEKDNPYDSFSTKVFKPDSPAEIVGHLSMEISRITKFIIDRGAQVAVKIRGRYYRRSSLVDGGLEEPCEIKLTMVGSIINHHLLVRYESLLKEHILNQKMKKLSVHFFR